jgi:LacI family transcriptional regulator
MVTIKEVAHVAGVSTATVSHVLNKTRYVSEEISKRVQDAIDTLQYVPNISAFSLRTRKTKTVSLLIPILINEIDCIFFSRIARGLESILSTKGYFTILCNTNDDLDGEMEAIRNCKNRMVDGMIITPVAREQSFIKEMNLQCPILFIDRPPPGLENQNCVLSDTLGGCKKAIGELIELGHTRIGFIGDPMFTPDERYDGYVQALLEHDIPLNKDFVRLGKTDFVNGYTMARDIFEKKTPVTALFLPTNLMAMGAMQYIREQHIGIPEELSILVFDDYNWAKIYNPPLTVIRQDAYGIGKKVGEVLLDVIDKGEDRIGEYRLPLTLVRRESWAPPGDSYHIRRNV